MTKKNIRPLKELGLSDNFMFGEVMSNMKLCKLFLEALLEKPIAKIVNISKERDLADAYTSHGIRLDVYLEDEVHTRYDVEMQCERQDGLEKRIRYYQGGIDRNFLEKGRDYDELPSSYVIFLCNHDYYGAGMAMYRRKCVIEDTDIPYDDGSHAIILNAKYSCPGKANHDILEFLDYIRTNDSKLSVSGELAKTAIELCEEAKSDSRLEEKYMTLQMAFRDEQRKGEAKAFLLMYRLGKLSLEEAAKLSRMSKDRFLAFAEEHPSDEE